MTPKARERIEELIKLHPGTPDSALFVDVLITDARKPKSALHDEFEWDAKQAHPFYLRMRARELIRQWYVTHMTATEQTVRSRRIVSLPIVDHPKRGRSYHMIEDVMRDDRMREALLDQALRELASFKQRYQNLVALTAVFEAIDEVTTSAGVRPDEPARATA